MASAPDARGGGAFVRLAATLRRELEQLERLVEEAADAANSFDAREPSLLELRGLGDIAHDFYTGAERLFERIAPELNGGVPAGPAWHRELLDTMTLDLPGIRPPVLRETTAQQLHEFLRFRHLFRHLYGFELRWEQLEPLLAKLPQVGRQLETDMRQFLLFLDEAAKSL